MVTPILAANSLTTCHTAFSVTPSPQALPALLTRRKSRPASIPAAFVHSSTRPYTQSGTGIVRTRPAFPLRSTIAQRPSRCCKWPNVSSASSWRRRPQDSRTASRARSRSPFSRSRFGACQSACPCSAVSQLPSLTPSFLTPLTRRIPAAKSALRRPQSEASYASRRTAPSRRLIVPGAKWRDSRCIR